MILLFSGGVDSFIAYHWLNKPPTIYFDINSRYSETERFIVNKLIPRTTIEKCIDLQSRESLDFNIPFRNLYLAMLAAKYSDEIIIVGIKGDNVSDKTPGIFFEFSRLLSKMENREIKVSSPFWHHTKEDIVEWYLSQGLPTGPLMSTVSCYSGYSFYCGQCASCYRKWVAFRNNGIELDFYSQQLVDIYLIKAKAGYYIEERNRSIIKATEDYLRGH